MGQNSPETINTVCDDAKFAGVTKMPANVRLSNIGICDSDSMENRTGGVK